MSARATTRADFAEGVKRAIDHELIEQNGFFKRMISSKA
jgi:hypothetical protein